MLKYGVLLNTPPDIYTHIDNYFNKPLLTKVKDIDGLSMYMTKTLCLLSGHCQYLVAFAKQDRKVMGNRKRLIDIKWESFQTRTLKDKHELEPHYYKKTAFKPLMSKIVMTSETNDSITYTCDDYNISVLLLKTKETPYYQPTGNLVKALETFQTIITKN